MFHYYDPLPKTDDVTASFAVNECQNCGKACEELTHVSEFDYMGCDKCMAEAMAVIERERLERIAGPPKCANCASQARWDSIYCSDRCKDAFLRSLSTEAA